MADPDQRRTEFGDELLHLRQDFRLDRDIQCGRGFIADNELGVMEKSDRNRHTLAHAAGKLVWEKIDLALGLCDANLRQRLDGPFTCFRRPDLFMGFERELDLGADAEYRVQRHHRILENHGNGLAADLAQFMRLKPDQFTAFKLDRALDDPAGFIDQADDGKAGDRLSRAGFTDEAENFAGSQ